MCQVTDCLSGCVAPSSVRDVLRFVESKQEIVKQLYEQKCPFAPVITTSGL